MNVKNMSVGSALIALVLGATVLAYGTAGPEAGRTDCPGKVVCPLTGEEVCADQCLLRDANRRDCPGKIECPLTGEPVCADQCPLAGAQAMDAGLPPCCRQK